MKLHGYKTCLVTLLAVLLYGVMALPAAAYTDMQGERNYSYDQTGKAVYISNAYTYAGAISLVDDKGVAANNPQDLYIGADGSLYVADTGNNRILILDKEYRFKGVVSQITDENGQVSSLNKPEGIYVFEDGELLIADTQNERIVRCDATGKATAIITKPSGMTGVAEADTFLPVKVACDSIDRISVVARNINLGIVQLDQAGTFLSYTGVPKVQTDLFTLFWRALSTKAQEEQMVEFISTEYSNIYIDSGDFIWGTISTLDINSVVGAINSRDKSGSVTPIRKLNSMGNDTLKRNGQFAPLGDLNITKDTTGGSVQPSAIIDVALGSGGIYSLLDKARGHIFTYDENGNLLYAFGGYGLKKADLQIPSAMSYIGDTIAVLDAGLGTIQTYSPTSYGKTVIEAVTHQYNGDFDEANALWTEIAGQNTNFEYAFEGLGSAQLNRGDYPAAIESFRFANNQNSYSEAFVLLRTRWMQTYFPYLFGGCLAVIVLLVLRAGIKRFLRYYRGEE